ncbi:MAG: hypothetical protein K6E47_06690 [Lachnospiraceae bacterium]|nr:hypothetical protein [Lachnospiraceae bacterium]
MRSFVDKIILMVFTALMLFEVFGEGQRVIAVFVMIITAAFMSYLRLIGKTAGKINIGLQYAAGLLIALVPEMIILLPIVIYEVFLDRQIAAGLVLFAASAYACSFLKVNSILFIAVLTGLAVYLAYRTKKVEILERDNLKIRDEGEIKKEMLQKQNSNLLEEQDKNIYTAQLSERNRIAREIHDNVGHMLSRSILQVGAMMVVHKDEPVAEELKSLRETLDTAMNNIRESVHDIRDDAIDLELAIKEMAEPLKGKFKLQVEFDADKKSVDKDIKYAVINIVKEAVSNIIKYSNNQNVLIRFDEHPSMYQLIIHDYGDGDNSKGIGKDTEKNGKSSGKKKSSLETVKSNGMGLENIRTRAVQLGGQANFSDENGFRIFVRIPKER